MKRFPAVPKFPLPAGTKRGDNSIPAADVEDEALDAVLIALGERRRAAAAATDSGTPAQQPPPVGDSVAAAAAGTPR